MAVEVDCKGRHFNRLNVLRDVDVCGDVNLLTGPSVLATPSSPKVASPEHWSETAAVGSILRSRCWCVSHMKSLREGMWEYEGPCTAVTLHTSGRLSPGGRVGVACQPWHEPHLPSPL